MLSSSQSYYERDAYWPILNGGEIEVDEVSGGQGLDGDIVRYVESSNAWSVWRDNLAEDCKKNGRMQGIECYLCSSTIKEKMFILDGFLSNLIRSSFSWKSS